MEFTRIYTGPFCTILLKELGGETIKIEFHENGDAAISIPLVTEGGKGYIFAILNRSKKSITLDLRSGESY